MREIDPHDITTRVKDVLNVSLSDGRELVIEPLQKNGDIITVVDPRRNGDFAGFIDLDLNDIEYAESCHDQVDFAGHVIYWYVNRTRCRGCDSFTGSSCLYDLEMEEICEGMEPGTYTEDASCPYYEPEDSYDDDYDNRRGGYDDEW